MAVIAAVFDALVLALSMIVVSTLGGLAATRAAYTILLLSATMFISLMCK
jgi:hypothetical protein